MNIIIEIVFHDKDDHDTFCETYGFNSKDTYYGYLSIFKDVNYDLIKVILRDLKEVYGVNTLTIGF